MGFDVCLSAVIRGDSKCVLLASDISPNTIKRFKSKLQSRGLEGDIDLLTMPLSIGEVYQYIGVNAGIIAICDKGFSKSIRKLF